MFIAFEGMDGVGKTTQMGLLAEALSDYQDHIMLLREPGGTYVGERIRNLLKSKSHDMTPETRLLLYMAARCELDEQCIKPGIELGKLILCDRYVYSTLVYQHELLNSSDVRGSYIDVLLNIAPLPDYTILLDMDAQAAWQRSQRGTEQDWYDVQSVQFYTKIRERYLLLADRISGYCTVVDADRDELAVHNEVLSVVTDLLNERGWFDSG